MKNLGESNTERIIKAPFEIIGSVALSVLKIIPIAPLQKAIDKHRDSVKLYVGLALGGLGIIDAVDR